MDSQLDGNSPEVTRLVEASAEDIWAVLSDGWAYASWVVGTARIRGVDAGWPKAGTQIHHSFGIWPALIDDSTEVLHADAGPGALMPRPIRHALITWRNAESLQRLAYLAEGEIQTAERA